MPQGVIGHGMPTGQQRDYASANTSNIQISFAAINFRELEGGKFTLGEALNKAEWDRLLPTPEVFSKYVKQPLFDSNFPYYSVLNFIQALTSLLFLVAVIGLSARFIRYVSNDELRANEDDFESARVFTDILGYFLAPFIITLSTAIINQLVLIMRRSEAKKNYKLVMNNYETLRNGFISAHNKIMAFFTIAEKIFELQKMISDRNYLEKLIKLEHEIKNIFTKVNLNYTLCDKFGVASITQLTPAVIIDQLKEILLGSEFTFIMKQLKFSIKKNSLGLLGKGVYNITPYSVIEAYDDKIDDDLYTQYIVLDIIGEISSKKTEPTPSILLKTIQLTEESTESTIKTALNKYWNSPDVKTPFIHPYDVDLGDLAHIINLKMQERFPGFIITAPVCQIQLPLPIPNQQQQMCVASPDATRTLQTVAYAGLWREKPRLEEYQPGLDSHPFVHATCSMIADIL